MGFKSLYPALIQDIHSKDKSAVTRWDSGLLPQQCANLNRS